MFYVSLVYSAMQLKIDSVIKRHGYKLSAILFDGLETKIDEVQWISPNLHPIPGPYYWFLSVPPSGMARVGLYNSTRTFSIGTRRHTCEVYWFRKDVQGRYILNNVGWFLKMCRLSTKYVEYKFKVGTPKLIGRMTWFTLSISHKFPSPHSSGVFGKEEIEPPSFWVFVIDKGLSGLEYW